MTAALRKRKGDEEKKQRQVEVEGGREAEYEVRKTSCGRDQRCKLQRKLRNSMSKGRSMGWESAVSFCHAIRSRTFFRTTSSSMGSQPVSTVRVYHQLILSSPNHSKKDHPIAPSKVRVYTTVPTQLEHNLGSQQKNDLQRTKVASTY
jgi:hypothetical protein